MIYRGLALGIALSLLATPVLAGMAGTKTMDSALGPVLATDNGMTLYTFDADKDGKSACNGPCAVNWPPLMAGKDAKASGDWSVITRDDGAMQWAFKGRPLYSWIKDAKPGDVTGDGVKGVWHAARP